jgi:hypothetical protein
VQQLDLHPVARLEHHPVHGEHAAHHRQGHSDQAEDPGVEVEESDHGDADPFEDRDDMRHPRLRARRHGQTFGQDGSPERSAAPVLIGHYLSVTARFPSQSPSVDRFLVASFCLTLRNSTGTRAA